MMLHSSTNLAGRVLWVVAISGAKRAAERFGVRTVAACLLCAAERRMSRASNIPLCTPSLTVACLFGGLFSTLGDLWLTSVIACWS